GPTDDGEIRRFLGELGERFEERPSRLHHPRTIDDAAADLPGSESRVPPLGARILLDVPSLFQRPKDAEDDGGRLPQPLGERSEGKRIAIVSQGLEDVEALA